MFVGAKPKAKRDKAVFSSMCVLYRDIIINIPFAFYLKCRLNPQGQPSYFILFKLHLFRPAINISLHFI